MPIYEQEELVVKAINSIPQRDDIEVICIDDCSRDNTYQIVCDLVKDRKNFRVFRNPRNLGVAFTINRGLDLVTGEYYLQLDCDDYFYTEELNKVIDMADMDLVFFNMRINDGTVWSTNVMKEMCDHGCLYRRSLIGNIRHPNRKADGGWFFHRDVISQPHTE